MFDSCICVDGYDGPEFAVESVKTARKEHKCCECHEVIKPGKKYENTRGKWEGNFETYKTCMPCTNIRKSLFSCGWIYGQMWEDLRETLWESGDEDEEQDWLK